MNKYMAIIIFSFLCVACGGGAKGANEPAKIEEEVETPTPSVLAEVESHDDQDGAQGATPAVIDSEVNSSEPEINSEVFDTSGIQASSDFLFKSIQQVKLSFSASAKATLGQGRVYLSICEGGQNNKDRACLFQGFVNVDDFNREVSIVNSVTVLTLQVWYGEPELETLLTTWSPEFGEVWQVAF